MRPKFEVGEVVILQSKSQPESNGEYTVAVVLMEGMRVVCRLGSGVGMLGSDTASYLFTEPVRDLAHPKGKEVLWAESALRKKHLPGELSFTNLMASLSSPKLITHQA